MLTLGNKLTLNSQPIYHFVNEHSVQFDGSDQCIVTDGADTVAQPTTYSFWCKSSTTGANPEVNVMLCTLINNVIPAGIVVTSASSPVA